MRIIRCNYETRSPPVLPGQTTIPKSQLETETETETETESGSSLGIVGQRRISDGGNWVRPKMATSLPLSLLLLSMAKK